MALVVAENASALDPLLEAAEKAIECLARPRSYFHLVTCFL
jgi:hypothetical protein